MQAPNRNYVWANLLVDELARAGLRAAMIAPGSRSTPLTLAFAAHPDITVYRHLDERSAGFFALGLAKASGMPVALVCTSGSAVANFFPAVVEANEARVPLIILTGDRPPELRSSGANQTIDQVKFFGTYARWSVDVALPEAEPAPTTLRYLRTTAGRAVAQALGNGSGAGVVHINVPFRKPLEPTPIQGDQATVPPSRDDGAAFSQIFPPVAQPDPVAMQHVVALIDRFERGLIVCGTNCPGGHFPQAVAALAAQIGYPLLAEPSSGLRFGAHVHEGVIAAYETFLSLADVPPCDVVIRFGDVPTSKWLNETLERAGEAGYVHVSADGVWADDLHRISHLIHADPVLACTALSAASARPNSAWLTRFQQLETETWAAIETVMAEEDFDATYVYDLVAGLPSGAHLFLGNSLSVRHVDQFGRQRRAALQVSGNRGASGIDGNISTALGIAAANPTVPLVMLIGDITLFHDMNGLFPIKDRAMDNVTIVLINNDGGGIFHRLPIQGYDPAFTDLFIMPHGLDFQHTAALYGLDYERVDDRAAFRERIAAVQAGQPARLIEIRTNGIHDETARRALLKRVRAHLQAIPTLAELPAQQ